MEYKFYGWQTADIKDKDGNLIAEGLKTDDLQTYGARKHARLRQEEFGLKRTRQQGSAPSQLLLSRTSTAEMYMGSRWGLERSTASM